MLNVSNFSYFLVLVIYLVVLAEIVAQSLDHDSSELLFGFGVLFKL